MPGILGLEQADAALGFVLWNLAKDILGELMLEFAEGRHAIVDAIEQNQNRDAGQQTDSEADKKAFD